MDPPPFQWRTFGAALAIVFTSVTAFWLLNPPRYLTNDDVGIRLGTEGGAVPGQPPTGFVLTTHAALGWSMVAVHRWLPAVPIWDLILAATFIWALAVLFAVSFTSLGSGWLARATTIVAVLAGVVPLLIGVQFTISATLAGGAAVLLALTELAAPSRRMSVLGMSLLLLLAGLLVRPMGAAAGGIAVGCCLMPSAVRARARRTRVTQAAGVLGAVVALFAGLTYLDGLLYRIDPDWDAYHRYNFMVARLAEWGGELPPADIETIRASAGWSRNDWAMMQRWLGVDPALHGFNEVASAYDTRTAIMGWDESLRWMRDRLGTVDRSTLREIGTESAHLLVVVGVLIGLYAGLGGGAATVTVMLLFSGLYVAIQIAFKDLPFRLLAPLQAGVLAAVLMTVGESRRRSAPSLSVVGLAAILTVVATQASTLVATAAADRRQTAQVEEEVAELQRVSPSLIVLHADAFPSERWWRPFVRPSTELTTIPLGGNNQNPLLQQFLSDTHRQPLFQAICDDPSILVVSEADRLNLITTYFREHFNTSVGWERVHDGSFRAWRCTKVTRAG